MRTIFHIDLNSFYANCEIIVSNGKYNHDSKLVVTGNPDARCGVVLAASRAAKACGAKAGMTLSEVRNLCPEVIFVKARFPLYFRMSSIFMSIIRNYSPLIERYGIDEAFLDYTGCERLLGPPEKTAYEIKERIKKETGMTVSIGVSHNKLLAKMGSDYKKPDAVTVITPENFHKLIWPLPVKDLIFVGKQTAQKLTGMSIQTVGDLATSSIKALKNRFGINGAVLWMYANGLDETPVINMPEPVKGIGNSSTLPNDAETLEEIKIMLLVHSEQVAKRLREINNVCRVVQIHFKDTKLNTRQHQATLQSPTDVTGDIYHMAVKLAAELWKGEKVRQIGVRVTGLAEAEEYYQASLFPEKQKEKRRHLDQCIDILRVKHGNNSICRGSIIAEGLNRGIWYEDVFS